MTLQTFKNELHKRQKDLKSETLRYKWLLLRKVIEEINHEDTTTREWIENTYDTLAVLTSQLRQNSRNIKLDNSETVDKYILRT